MTDIQRPCPLCGADVSQETGFADNFGNGEHQYASCSECSYQADWGDHVALRSPEPAQADQVHQWRRIGCSYWYEGHPDPADGGGPYEIRVLYAAPPASVDRNAVLEAAAKAAYDALHPHPNHPESDWTEYAHAHAAAARKASAAIRALRTEAPAQEGE